MPVTEINAWDYLFDADIYTTDHNKAILRDVIKVSDVIAAQKEKDRQ